MEFVQTTCGRLAYRRVGQGPPLVLLHGNPTSSFLWRHVQPALAATRTVVALDLPGMGESEELPGDDPGRYTFEANATALAEFLHALHLDHDLVLVGHDWGAVLAFDWARKHPGDVAGLAYMETMVRPRSWAEESDEGQLLMRRLRTPEGEPLVLQDNVFIESILTAGMLGQLTPTDHEVYRAPYRSPGERRRPMLRWAQQIPFDGEPPETAATLAACARFLQDSSTPKLFLRADPGSILVGDAAAFAASFPNQTEVRVRASHFVPEDDPAGVTSAIVDWLAGWPGAGPTGHGGRA